MKAVVEAVTTLLRAAMREGWGPALRLCFVLAVMVSLLIVASRFVQLGLGLG